MIANSESDLDADMPSVIKSIEGRHNGTFKDETDIEKVREIQDREWRIVPAAMEGWTVQAGGFDIAGTYDLENAQAILANHLDRQSLRAQVDTLIEANKRMAAALRNHIDAVTKHKM